MWAMKFKGGELTLEARLRAARGKRAIAEVVAWVGGDRGRFAELMGFLASDDFELAVRSAWVGGWVVEEHPEHLAEHLTAVLDVLERPGLSSSVARGIFRMLEFGPVSGECEGRVMEVAMAALGGPMPVAVKVYAMTVLKRLVGDYPELMGEVRLLIEEQLRDAGPGFRSRARREFGLGRDGMR
jgi:hypothetical protein